MSRFSALWGALRAARWADLGDCGEAQAALLQAQAMQWLLSPGDLVEVSRTEARVVLSPAEREAGQRLADAVDRASRYGVFRPHCLARAVALSRMLDNRGINGHRIRIGVRKTAREFTAHAWVELGGAILGDADVNTSIYTPLTDVTLSRRNATRENTNFGVRGEGWS